MKKWLLHILLVGMLGMHTTSCVTDDDLPAYCPEKEEVSEKVMIRFTIATENPTTSSRSLEGYDPDEENSLGVVGSEDENKINDVQVLVYDWSGVLINQLDIVEVVVDDESTGKHVYDVIGSFEVDRSLLTEVTAAGVTTYTMDFKLMVFANSPTITNLNEYYSLTSNYEGWTLSDGIPMWGLAKFDDAVLYTTVAQAQATPSSITPVYMLRSMAKIEVSLSAETVDAGYSLTAASLNQAMSNGFVVPALKGNNNNPFTLASLTATTNLGLDEVFHPSTDGLIDSNTTISFQEETGENEQNNTSYYIYVPEFQVNEENPLEISLTVNDGTTDSVKTFKHGTYENGTLDAIQNVIRNHYYQYTVTINSGEDLEVIITIHPWNKRIFTYDPEGLA